MSPITERATKRSSTSRRTRLALIVAAVIVLLPGLITAILYSRHRKTVQPLSAESAAERDKMVAATAQKLALSGDLKTALDEYQQILKSYPADARTYDALSVVYGRLGQYDKATEAARQALKLAPDHPAVYEHLGYYALALQRPEEAHNIVREGQKAQLDAPGFHKVLYTVTFFAPLGPLKPAMSDQLQWFARRPEYESDGLALASNTAAYTGHLSQARDLTQRAAEAATKAGDIDLAAVWRENSALREAAFGNLAEGRKQAEAGLKLGAASGHTKILAALALAMAGDPARATALAQEASRQLPDDTLVQLVWLPAVRAQVALGKKNSRQAIEDLSVALPLELGESLIGPNPSCMYSTYLRGQAYLYDQNATAATIEFQKILNHNGVVWNCWTGALAHLGLARARLLASVEFEGEDAEDARVEAVLAYRDFLKLWKEADPEIPLLTQAKEESAGVRQ
jgi:eukaryotic-like serine/threonine-protein kinase